MATFYRAHNNRDALAAPAEGWCLTNDRDIALRYGFFLATVKLDMDELTTCEVEGYDHDSDTTPADSRAFRAAQGADVLTYDDETERGEFHRTWRLASNAAVAACRVVSVFNRDDLDDLNDLD